MLMYFYKYVLCWWLLRRATCVVDVCEKGPMKHALTIFVTYECNPSFHNDNQEHHAVVNQKNASENHCVHFCTCCLPLRSLLQCVTKRHEKKNDASRFTHNPLRCLLFVVISSYPST
mmetsp:Transcript_4550/g.17198  ORF Transcript_4550/g.17198 Transcript_4550/m.17198 type:complete len:117 (-) Transcript_4550:300-650(-)